MELMLGCPVHRNQTGHSGRIINEKKGEKKGSDSRILLLALGRDCKQAGESFFISLRVENRGKMRYFL